MTDHVENCNYSNTNLFLLITDKSRAKKVSVNADTQSLKLTPPLNMMMNYVAFHNLCNLWRSSGDSSHECRNKPGTKCVKLQQ